MNNAIQIQNIGLKLDGKEILRDISFTVNRGEYVSIIGPNGAGKTTLLRCLLGMYAAYTGTLSISGKECRDYGQRELARFLSYVPQTHDIEFPLSVYDFVMMGRYPYLTALAPEQPHDRTAVHKAMQITRIEPFAARTLRTLSGGERQRVYIAAALAQETPVILLDEPATFLDWRHQAEIMAMLKQINTECGTTIIAVNHDLNSAARWSDRIVALRDGQTFRTGTPNELIQPGPLEELFETPFKRIGDETESVVVTV